MSTVDSGDVDYYDVLSVPSSATKEEIKRAFRKKARAYHPDKNPSKEARKIFESLKEAAEFLADDEKRRVYDNRIKAKLAHKKRLESEDANTRVLREKLERREREAKARMMGQRDETLAKQSAQKNAELLKKMLQEGRLGRSTNPANTTPHAANTTAPSSSVAAPSYSKQQSTPATKASSSSSLPKKRKYPNDDPGFLANVNDALRTVSVRWKRPKPDSHPATASDVDSKVSHTKASEASILASSSSTSSLSTRMEQGNDENSIRDVFSTYGPVENVMFNASKGLAFVLYRDSAVADAAASNPPPSFDVKPMDMVERRNSTTSAAFSKVSRPTPTSSVPTNVRNPPIAAAAPMLAVGASDEDFEAVILARLQQKEASSISNMSS